ncbi:MAG: hypothetical protein M1819_000931 [Sarea resinae]|nr:MAG: hypothetical protein M1819_000931 [Sarea resinae]
MAADFDAPVSKVLRPSHLAHVVLRTSNLRRMVSFYTTFLGGTVTHENEVLSFITYDEEHHRIAILELPDTAPKIATSSGLDHISFSFDTLADLFLSYRHRKQHGIEPVWCVNHGPTTSIYYKDPDENVLETQVDNFDTVAEASEFMRSANFAENPIGTDIDPEDLIKRIESGEDETSLKTRNEIGPRGVPDFSAMKAKEWRTPGESTPNGVKKALGSSQPNKFCGFRDFVGLSRARMSSGSI